MTFTSVAVLISWQCQYLDPSLYYPDQVWLGLQHSLLIGLVLYESEISKISDFIYYTYT